jgi:hypothetical protein
MIALQLLVPPPPWASLGYGTVSGALDNEHKPSKLRRIKIPSSNLRRGPVLFVVIIVHSLLSKNASRGRSFGWRGTSLARPKYRCRKNIRIRSQCHVGPVQLHATVPRKCISRKVFLLNVATSVLGHKLPRHAQIGVSALPPKAAATVADQHVR